MFGIVTHGWVLGAHTSFIASETNFIFRILPGRCHKLQRRRQRIQTQRNISVAGELSSVCVCKQSLAMSSVRLSICVHSPKAEPASASARDDHRRPTGRLHDEESHLYGDYFVFNIHTQTPAHTSMQIKFGVTLVKTDTGPYRSNRRTGGVNDIYSIQHMQMTRKPREF